MRDTLAHLFHESDRRFHERALVHVPLGGKRWQPLSARELGARRQRIAAGLSALGLEHKDRIAILSETRLEWTLVDSAVLSMGGVVVGVYPTMTPEQMAYVLSHSEARACFVEDQVQLERVLSRKDELPALEHLILFPSLEGERPPGVLTLAELEARGEHALDEEPTLFSRLIDGVSPDDIATLIYTSGTTGHPKGAVLTHGALTNIARSQAEAAGIDHTDVGVAFLPLAHALTRVAGYSAALVGTEVWFAESLDKLGEAFEAARPTTLAAVPRVFEKIHARILAAAAAQAPHRRALFRRALDVGLRYSRAVQRGERIGRRLSLEHALYEKLVYARVRERVFGDRSKHIHSGGAPLSRELLEFFHALGVLVLEGYGLTETCSPATLNTESAWRFGSVGRPLPGVEIRLDEDGEILIKSPGLFREYWRDPEATRAAFTADGWFRTGDIGALDDDGFLRVTDRKKDLIITAGGKNLAPQPLENRLKEQHGVSHAMVYGDRRPYLVALLTADDEALADLSREERERLVRAAVEKVNASVARYETIKRWRLLERDFSVEDGTLTPSLKVKRRAVLERYRDVIEQLYEP